MFSQILKKVAQPSLRVLTQPNLHLKVLDIEHNREVLELLTQRFSEDEPLSSAFYQLISKPRHEIRADWRIFWDCFSEDYLNNGISVGIFDSDYGGKLVGVSVAKDLTFVPKGFSGNLQKLSKVFNGLIEMESKMIEMIRPEYRSQISSEGKVMDVWGVTIHKEYTGKRLLHKMMEANEALGIDKGFKYGFCYASNFKTGKGLQKLGYEKVAEINAKEYELDGFKYFQLLEEINSRPSLWMKPFLKQPYLNLL